MKKVNIAHPIRKPSALDFPEDLNIHSFTINLNISIIKMEIKINPYFKWSNYNPVNVYYTIQGHYRALIVRLYNRFVINTDLASKIIKYSKCLGNCPECGCPWAELLLSNKECTCKTI